MDNVYYASIQEAEIDALRLTFSQLVLAAKAGGKLDKDLAIRVVKVQQFLDQLESQCEATRNLSTFTQSLRGIV